MKEWKERFDETSLEWGKKACLNRKVVDLTRTEKGYSAAVLERQRAEVVIKMTDDDISRMNCQCAIAKSGKNCRHMAAVLYAIDMRKEAEQSRKNEEKLMKLWRENEEKHAAEEQKKSKLQIKRRRTAYEKEELKRREEERVAEEKKRLEEEEAAREKRRIEEEKAVEEKKRQEEEKAAKKLAREQRKAKKARQDEERKKIAEQRREKEAERIRAEEARKEEIRNKKKEEAKRREEKRRLEEEGKRRAEELKKEEEKRKAEKLRKAEEERIVEELRRKEEQRLAEERMLSEVKKRQQERARRQMLKKDYETLENPWHDDSEEMDSEKAQKRMNALENYSYFRPEVIRNAMKFSKAVQSEAEKVIRNGKLRLDEVGTGYNQMTREILGQTSFSCEEDGIEFPVYVQFARDELLSLQCHCPECRMNYYGWYYSKNQFCKYKAGALLETERILKDQNIGDATDYSGKRVLSSFSNKRMTKFVSDMEAEPKNLRLVPRLVMKDGKLTLTFKVGENKLFVVKKLNEFCENVKNASTAVYGSSTNINHNIENFTEESRKWIHFINQVVRDENAFARRMMESRNYYSYQKQDVGGSVDLYGWRLDEFYNQMGGEPVEYENRDKSPVKKIYLEPGIGEPKIQMRISADTLGTHKEFHGVRVRGNLPELFYGVDTAYYISGTHFMKVEPEFLGKMEPLTRAADGGSIAFLVGRNHMAEFFYRTLPQLREVADITEAEPEKFRSYLPPEVQFRFDLDAPEQDVVCRALACYGEQEFSLTDYFDDELIENMAAFRDYEREQETIAYLFQYFPEINWESESFSCGKDEERIYNLMKNGLDKMLELGEVRCTKSFLGYRTINRVRVSAGVSVSEGMLNLEISTTDVPMQELLELLQSYRTKKKYYRLKDGSFVDLENSPLEALNEMIQGLHVKPKEFLKGQLHLPMYRTLYLDKLLEENESIYSNRDSHFRKIIKGFKTVKEADFEEPESLSKVMRPYQKDGFKWLRTLEEWGFGGILADDMGLGKTLQAIAVLLSAKQEGKEGTSLIIAPASLVFNWQEEFSRFASELRVNVVAGTQNERRNIVENWKDVDVLITSYDLLKRDIGFYDEKTFLYEIIDEAQYIKNHSTAAAKAVKVIQSKTRYALTGTPIENRLSELWSIFDYLMPGFLYSYEAFRKELEIPIAKNRDEAATRRLQKMTAPFILRRLKENVLKDLPEKMEEIRYVKFEDTQQKLYDGQVLHLKQVISEQDNQEFNKNKLQVLAEITKLRQICCDPSLCFEHYRGEAAKVDACLDLVQSAMDGGHRILLFSQFTSMLDILKENFDKAGIPYFLITGSTAKEKRLELVREFNEGDTPVFLISLKAGGVGLNLTGADVVIHYDPWWNQAVQNQATDRAHRIGQTRKVTVYKLLAKNTIEEKIQKLQEKKTDLATQILSGENGYLGSMNRDELLELLDSNQA